MNSENLQLGVEIVRELYQFKCLECELEFKLGREKGGRREGEGLKLYNVRTKEISSLEKSVFYFKHPIGITSNSPVRKIVQVENQDGEIKLNCPRCYSDQTLIFRLDDWIVDYQVW